MVTPAISDSWMEIILGGVPIPLTGPLPDNSLITYPRRLVIGDPGLDANPLLSALVMSDFSGGNGVEDLNESTDTTRYLIGSLYTRYPKMISKPYKVNDGMVTTTASVQWRFLGDLKYSGTWTGFVTGGTGGSIDRVVYSLPYGGSPTSEGTLTAAPVNTSVRFRGVGSVDRLFIPMGASGYATVDADATFTFANVTADATHPALVHAAVLGYKLVGIDITGELWYTTDGATWTLFGTTANLPTSEEPKKLISYFDRGGQPALFILTDTRIVQFDEGGPNIFDVDVSFPPHPYGGMAGTKWNADLYYSVGMGATRYTGGSASPMGLDRDSGLPAAYAGYIVDLAPGHNSMYALVQGVTVDSVISNTIMEYTQSGWHEIWETRTAASSVVPNSMGISRSGDKYSLYWGVTSAGSESKGIFRIDLPIADSNPRNSSNILTTAFASGTFFLQSGIYDMNMRGTTKLAAALDVTVEAIDTTAVLRVYYRTDGFEDTLMSSSNSTLLGEIRSSGSFHLQFGEQDDYGIYPGLQFEKIQFYFHLTDSTNNPFIMESAVLAFVKMVAPSDSWTAQIDLSKNHGGNSPDFILEHIKTLIAARQATSMVYRGETKRVLITQHSGTAETGSDERSFRTLSLLEIPDGLDTDG